MTKEIEKFNIHIVFERRMCILEACVFFRFPSRTGERASNQFLEGGQNLGNVSLSNTEVISSALSSSGDVRGKREPEGPPISEVMQDQDLKTPSSSDGLNFYGTLQLGDYELPLYQMSGDQLKQLQIDHAFSFQGTSATISRSSNINADPDSPVN